MTVTAALALIAAHQCVSPSVAPIIVGIADHESGLEPLAIHDNVNGKTYMPKTVEQAVLTARSLIAVGHASLDLGIAQVNTSNFAWTGLTLITAFDPCRNFAAGANVLFARYNGSPPGPVRQAYAAATNASIDHVETTPSPTTPERSSPPPLRDALHSPDPGGLVDLLAGQHPQQFTQETETQ